MLSNSTTVSTNPIEASLAVVLIVKQKPSLATIANANNIRGMETKWFPVHPFIVHAYSLLSSMFFIIHSCCGHPSSPSPLSAARVRLLYDAVKAVCHTCPDEANHGGDPGHVALRRLLPILEKQDWSSSTLYDLHRKTLAAIQQFHDACPFASSSESDAAYTVSRYFLLQDMKPETWKKLQLAHISFFPSMQW